MIKKTLNIDGYALAELSNQMQLISRFISKRRIGMAANQKKDEKKTKEEFWGDNEKDNDFWGDDEDGADDFDSDD